MGWAQPNGTSTDISRWSSSARRPACLEIIRWVRLPSSFAVRVVVAILLIAGGIFSFLPVLGLWMLPLGLLLIAQDVPFLQKPIVSALCWIEAKWNWLRTKWKSSSWTA